MEIRQQYNQQTGVSMSRGKNGHLDNRDTLIHSRDAVSTGAGAMIGFSLFGSSTADYFAGGAVLTLVILWLSTPKVFDIETQFSYFEAFHQNKYNRFVRLLTVWPHYLTVIVMILGYSHHWAFLLSTIYSIYFVMADTSLVGITAAIGASAVYPLAKVLIDQIPNAWEYALCINALCWTCQLCGDFICERKLRPVSFSTLFLENYVHTMLMAPLFFVIELSMALGFRKNMRFLTGKTHR